MCIKLLNTVYNKLAFWWRLVSKLLTKIYLLKFTDYGEEERRKRKGEGARSAPDGSGRSGKGEDARSGRGER